MLFIICTKRQKFTEKETHTRTGHQQLIKIDNGCNLSYATIFKKIQISIARLSCSVEATVRNFLISLVGVNRKIFLSNFTKPYLYYVVYTFD